MRARGDEAAATALAALPEVRDRESAERARACCARARYGYGSAAAAALAEGDESGVTLNVAMAAAGYSAELFEALARVTAERDEARADAQRFDRERLEYFEETERLRAALEETPESIAVIRGLITDALDTVGPWDVVVCAILAALRAKAGLP